MPRVTAFIRPATTRLAARTRSVARVASFAGALALATLALSTAAQAAPGYSVDYGSGDGGSATYTFSDPGGPDIYVYAGDDQDFVLGVGNPLQITLLCQDDQWIYTAAGSSLTMTSLWYSGGELTDPVVYTEVPLPDRTHCASEPGGTTPPTNEPNGTPTTTDSTPTATDSTTTDPDPASTVTDPTTAGPDGTDPAATDPATTTPATTDPAASIPATPAPAGTSPRTVTAAAGAGSATGDGAAGAESGLARTGAGNASAPLLAGALALTALGLAVGRLARRRRH